MASITDRDVVSNPILEAFARAPVGEPFTPEQRAELDQIMAEITDGKMPLVLHGEVHAWTMQNSAEDAEFAAE